jgi:hypothetical protein
MTTTNTRGARDRFYFCAVSAGKGKITMKPIKAATKDEAAELFEQLYQMAPQAIDDGEGNGYYVAKGTGLGEVSRVSVTVSASQLARRTSQAYSGEFRGWKVWASGLNECEIEGEKFAENELVSIEFDSLVDPAVKVPKPKLKKREVIRLTDLENVESV